MAQPGRAICLYFAKASAPHQVATNQNVQLIQDVAKKRLGLATLTDGKREPFDGHWAQLGPLLSRWYQSKDAMVRRRGQRRRSTRIEP